MRGCYVQIDGLKVYYEKIGAGPGYVFILPGWGCTAALYRYLAEGIAKKYTVIILELPGFGQSQEPSRVWKTIDYSFFCIHFIKHFTTGPVILLGHSNGVRIMITMSISHQLPFTIQKMVFIDGAGLLPHDYDQYLATLNAFIQKKHELEEKRNVRDLQFLKNSANSDYGNLSDLMIAVCKEVIADNYYEQLPQINVPTLLIWGENDIDTPVLDGKIMAKRIPDAGLVVIKNAGHFPFLDKPYEIRLILNSFLNID